MLDFLYAEWTHPYFISINAYQKLMEETSELTCIKTDDWTEPTVPSWLHSIWVGAFDPLPVFSKPRLWPKVFRDSLTLVRMHKSFKSGLMQYGMMTATKKSKE
jgi:MPBQ/MSBQ methyltransferase